MGRCLSPCLGDLDPNLYRRRLDAALGLLAAPRDGGGPLLAHLDAEMRRAADAHRFERAAALRRRRLRLEVLLERLGGALRCARAAPRLVRAAHPEDPSRADLAWLVGGRIADLAPLVTARDAMDRTRDALRRHGGPGSHLPAHEVDEVRIADAWVAAHGPPVLALDPLPAEDRLAAFLRAS